MDNQLKLINTNRLFYFFVFTHLLLWTLVPVFIRDNLPLDSIEGTIWGHQLEWGYDKNPFLNGWLTALATYWGGSSGWMIYLFSQLSVILCFWAIWQIAKNILTPIHALISILILEGIQYYNFHAIDFNDNTLELSLWALTIYFFYRALQEKNNLYAWIMTGFFAALCMIAKYYNDALIKSMDLLLLSDSQHRKQLCTWPPYIGLTIFIVVILPHVIWLFFHDYITVQYVFQRTSSPPSWTNHFYFPAQFAWQQCQVFLPALILFSFLLIGKKSRVTQSKKHIRTFDKQFLFYAGMGPFLLTLLLSILLGIKLRAGWGMPLLSLWGVILLAYTQPHLTKIKLYGFYSFIFILMGVFLYGYRLSLIDSPDASSANFPGKQIATTITQKWRAQYHRPLNYVAGSRWISGNISFYSEDHPSVFIEWNRSRSPFITIKQMKQEGAVFVWDITDHETLPEDIQKQFPQLQKSQMLIFDWLRNKQKIAPIQLGIAMLPPTKK